MRRGPDHQNEGVTDTNLVGYGHTDGDPANGAERRWVHDRVIGARMVPKARLA